MADSSVHGLKKPNMTHCRKSLIHYMGEVVNGSSTSIAPLKKIVASKEFAGLLELLSRVGTQKMLKLLERASRDCRTKQAENAKKNVRKRAAAVDYRPGSTKRTKLHDNGGSDNLSEEVRTASSLHERNQGPRRELRLLRSRVLVRNAEDEANTMLALGPDTPLIRHSGPSSPRENDARPRVKTEDEDPSSLTRDRSGNTTQNAGQVGGEKICTGEKSQLAYEDGGKITTMGTAQLPEAPGAEEKALQLYTWETYRREVGIIRRDPQIIAPIENYCCKAQGSEWDCHSGNPKKELNELLNAIEQLDFYFAKTRLVRYLNNRQAKMGIQPETPATWNMSEPQHVLGALRTLGAICDDTHIHRAFAQMRLYLLVQKKLDSGFKPIYSGKGKARLPENLYLEKLARGEAGPVSEEEIEASYHNYHSEYQAGKRWLEVADWFGGPGIVLVFITAAAGWKVFQRHCLKYISQSLCSIKGLVGALGTDCLENYCRYGQLSQKHINSVIEYEGIIPPEEIDEDGSESDETEDDTSDIEFHDANEAENGIQTSDSESDDESGSDEDISKHNDDASEHGQKDLRAEEDDDMEE